MPVQVQPATAARWDDLVTVFGRRGANPSWCWCQLFLGSSGGARQDNRLALRQEITHAAVPPGLIAYVADRPVGWTRVGPRSTLPRVTASRALARLLAESSDAWWVACLAIDSHHRRSGIGTALLHAAVSFARDHGATVVEGHPVDVAALTASRVSGAALYPGTLAMFVAAGFHEVGRTFPSRPVMRLLM